MRLLLNCARTSTCRLAPLSSSDHLSASIAAVNDWEAFLLLTRDHHLVPLIYKCLSHQNVSGVPSEIIAELRTLYLRIAALNMRLTHQLATIQQVMREAQIPCWSVKGPALAVQAFGSPSLRQYGDLDLIIPATHMLRAHALLTEMEFQLIELPQGTDLEVYARTLQEWSYVSRNNHTVLDIHPVVVSHIVTTPAMTLDLLNQTVEISIDERLTIHAPDPGSMLLIVCMNGACEMWKKLSDVVDVKALLTSHADADWGGLLEQATKWGQRRSLLIGVALAESLLALELPPPFHTALAKDAKARTLSSEAATRLLSGTSTREDVTRERLFGLRTRESIRDRARYLLRQCCVPSAIELNMVHLPYWLRGGYYLMRPFRLLVTSIPKRRS
ncbi:MAG: nucleotidyltransferase family protein [Verrucomicrobia bacterium]|nr:nucleotidyltransferase family protein [Verrucomicrobiota bacterium]MBT7065524.1 nucleotidyltransferase family protein [Verrucomicrobiota bacterium]MBT7700874.1 nucleotidyltransferase family protein [Verrucomicrobiota bacterium]